MEKNLYDEYSKILREELVPAMGCTEPISLAYAGALAAKHLNALPERIDLMVSGNIIKNVKSVIVPNTGGRKGLRTAVSAGVVYGDSERELEVLSRVKEDDLKKLDDFLDKVEIHISTSDYMNPFDIQVRAYAGEDESFVHIFANHTNVVEIKRNGEYVLRKEFKDEPLAVKENRRLLTVENIVEYGDTVDLEEIREVLERQIEYNMAIAETGLSEDYGATIGKILLKAYGDGVQNKAKAYAAAGSDARMNGCELPVVINSGSGNQGITSSVPVIVYAKELGAPHEKLLRALAISNLISIHIKTGIGSLSAYCGVTSAGAGAGAGISYLHGGGYKEIAHTIVNTLAINSGMICDGAKSSCAAKIASAVESGLLGMKMYQQGSQFYDGDGIVIKGVENTINAIGLLAREGMHETDKEILKIMMGE